MSINSGFAALDEQQLRQFVRLKYLMRRRVAEVPASRARSLPIIRPPEGCENAMPRLLDYKELPTPTSIRLLRLFPLDQLEDECDWYKPIHCSMTVKDLNDSPVYDALSYTWGDPLTLYRSCTDVSSPEAWAAPAFEIFCDGKALSVGTNLWTALIALRLALTYAYKAVKTSSARSLTEELMLQSGEVDYIWIDALCINQTDLHERSQQVLLMGRIYRQAKYVKIWLGGEDCYARSALKTLETLRVRIKNVNEGENWRSLSVWDRSIYGTIGLPVITPQQWLELYAFLNRNWFRRVWIVQEFAMAKAPVAFCGTMLFRFEDVARAILLLEQSRWIQEIVYLAERRIEYSGKKLGQDEEFSAVDIMLESQLSDTKFYQPRPGNHFDAHTIMKIIDTRAALGNLGDGHSTSIQARDTAQPGHFWATCQKHRTAESTNARDKIYALMGMSKEFLDLEQDGKVYLFPDYTKSIRDVYIEAAKKMIGPMGNLRLLSLKESRQFTKLTDLPSWVPDFSTDDFPEPLELRGPSPWTASMALAAGNIEYTPRDELQVRGVKVAAIKEHLVARSIGLAEGEIAKCAELLTFIPEVSKIQDPIMSNSFRTYLREGELNAWQHPRTDLPRDLQANGDVREQSRFEVLWRTTLADSFAGQHPAPINIGSVTKSFVEKHIISKEFLAVLAAMKNSPIWPHIKDVMIQEADKTVSDMQRNIPSFDDAKKQLGIDYTAWQKIQGLIPYESTRLLYPPDFLSFVRQLNVTFLEEKAKELITNYWPRFTHLRSETPSLKGNLVREVQTRMDRFGVARTLFVTDKGHLGIGDQLLEVGDEVWVLAGGSVPFVMRPHEGRHRLVGEAYVHGIMHGEAVAGLASSHRVETITIV